MSAGKLNLEPSPHLALELFDHGRDDFEAFLADSKLSVIDLLGRNDVVLNKVDESDVGFLGPIASKLVVTEKNVSAMFRVSSCLGAVTDRRNLRNLAHAIVLSAICDAGQEMGRADASVDQLWKTGSQAERLDVHIPRASGHRRTGFSFLR